jgi:uncharacterized protein (TIGR03790 family)
MPKLDAPWCAFAGKGTKNGLSVAVSLICLAMMTACEPKRVIKFEPPSDPLPEIKPSKVAKLAIGVSDGAASERYRHVLLIVNEASETSMRIGEYFSAVRKIAKSKIVRLSCTPDEQLSEEEFKTRILDVVRGAIKKSPDRIDYMVTTKGVPIRIGSGMGYSVDSMLASMNLTLEPIPEDLSLLPKGWDVAGAIDRSKNPFFLTKERFRSDKFNMYLVTRLDGFEFAHIKRMIDNAANATAQKGLFFFDEAANRNNQGYEKMQVTLGQANALLKRKGKVTRLDESPSFVAPPEPLMGYASWGSNDDAYKKEIYHRLKFRPGALAETFVSTSGRTFYRNSGPGQSLIADLIEQGITGVKGYVSEPWTFSLANPALIFDYYTSGFNLAESFYGASPIVKWKDVVIGDPLCNPYGR